MLFNLGCIVGLCPLFIAMYNITYNVDEGLCFCLMNLTKAQLRVRTDSILRCRMLQMGALSGVDTRMLLKWHNVTAYVA